MSQHLAQLRTRFMALVFAVALVLVSVFAGTAFAAEPTPLISSGTTPWTYHEKGTDPAEGLDRTAWTQADFATKDKGWKSAYGSFGAKKGKVASLGVDSTGVDCTPNVLLNQYLEGGSEDVPAYFFRTTFKLDSLDDFENLKAVLAYDDAAIVYVNGHKVHEGNVPAKGYATNNSYGAQDGHSAPSVDEFLITKNSLKVGDNILAVEIHQDRPTSSDIYFDFRNLTKVVAPTTEDSGVTNEVVMLGDKPGTVHFVWNAESTKPGKVQLAPAKSVTEGKLPKDATSVDADVTKEALKEGYVYNMATVTGLAQGGQYVYRVGNDEGWSPLYPLTLGPKGDFSFIWMGDPQIGAGEEKADTQGWKNTLNEAYAKFPGIDFTFSAGDQVNIANNESQYDGYLAPLQLKTHPLAVTVGNHDTWAPNYSQHFRAPGKTSDAATQTEAGDQSGDTSFMYNDVLFMVLNSNDRSSAEHKAFMQKCIAAHPEAKWKVVTFHHATYSTATHSEDTDILARRAELSPIFTELNIDLVLMGHDHVYTRSFMMDGITPDKTTGTDVIEDHDDGKVLYITANSASGSKFYTIKNLDFPYAAVKNQERVPNYTKVDVSDRQIKIVTYRSTDNSVVDKVTLKKPDPAVVNEVAMLGDKPGTVHFVWDSTADANAQVALIPADQVKGDKFPVESATLIRADVTKEALKEGYYYNMATATGLTPGAQYKYVVGDGTNWSPIHTLHIGPKGDFSFFWMGDPQIGAGEKKADTKGWINTLKVAYENNPDAHFTFSAGDQVNKADNESQYEGYLKPEQLKDFPLAVTVGNHDTYAPNYSQHFRAPAKTSDPATQTKAGDQSGDTAFMYNDVLFMVLNSNDRSTAEHKAFMEKQLAAHPDAKWRVVTFHHATYSTATHSEDKDILARRAELSPVFTELNIDLVLMGHDHVYTRSYMMNGVTPDKTTGGNVINDYDDGKVLYVTANSASGSKFYTIKNLDFPYAAVKNQERVPNYTKVSVSDKEIRIVTHRSTDNSVVDDVTLRKAQAGPAVTNEVVMLGDKPGTVHFVWNSKSDKNAHVVVVPADKVKGDKLPVAAAKIAKADVTKQALKEGYFYNMATVDGLTPGAQYKYVVGNGEDWSPIHTLHIGGKGNFSFFWMGDPQIGAGEEKADTEGWINTLNVAYKNNPDAHFTFSAGDQVNKANNEAQYDGYLKPEQLKEYPLAVNVGNHDSYAPNYSQHFRAPGKVSDPATQTEAGDQSGDTAFMYNGALFITLNSNDRSSAEHKAFMEKALAAHPNAKWKIVTFHHATYSTATHSEDKDILARRAELSPIFTELNIDLVLMGHDHVYTRSYMMKGVVPDTTTGGKVIEDKDDGKVLYITANSASGSKFYTIKNLDFPYAAVKNQERVPNYTKVSVTDNEIRIVTHRSTDNSVVDDVTLRKAGTPVTPVTPDKPSYSGGEGGTITPSPYYNGSYFDNVVNNGSHATNYVGSRYLPKTDDLSSGLVAALAVAGLGVLGSAYLMLRKKTTK